MINFMFGDSIEGMKKIPSGSVDLILTDPPYGTTACKWDTVIPFEPMWEQLHRVIKKNGAVVLFGSEPFSSALRMSNIEKYRYNWYWLKNKPTQFPNANHRPLANIEDMLVFSEGKPNPAAKNKMCYFPQGLVEDKRVLFRNSKNTTVNNGERDGSLNGQYTSNYKNYPRQLLEFDSETNTVHATQKPVALMEYLIKTYTKEGETVLDFTCGSGSTLEGCKNTNRNGIGIDNGYCEKDKIVNGVQIKGLKWIEIAQLRLDGKL